MKDQSDCCCFGRDGRETTSQERNPEHQLQGEGQPERQWLERCSENQKKVPRQVPWEDLKPVPRLKGRYPHPALPPLRQDRKTVSWEPNTCVKEGD